MARGIASSGDILTRTRDGQDLNAIWRQYQEALAAFNATRQPFIDLFASPVTDIIEDVTAPGQEKFEKASEYGIPVAIRPAPAPTQRAYPFEWWDTRTAYTFQFLAGGKSGQGATQAQLDNMLNQVLEADNQLQYDLVMKALWNSANRTADVNGLPYTVTALYNADGAYIPPYRGQTFNGATHTHYLGTGAGGQTSFDPNDITELGATIEHHGYDVRNGWKIVFLMNPTDLAAGPQTYRRGVAHNNGVTTVTSLYDFIPAQGNDTTLILPPGYSLAPGNRLPSNTFAGLDVKGAWGPYTFVGDVQIPLGYMAAIATQGSSETTNIVGVREHDDPSLRGVVLRPGPREAYPLVDSFYIRGMGTGVRQRGGAAIMQLNVASYTTPSVFAW